MRPFWRALRAYRDAITLAKVTSVEEATEAWRRNDWRLLTPLLQGVAVVAIPFSSRLSGDDVDDIVATVLWRALRVPEVPRNPMGWARVVAHRAALDVLKRRQHESLRDDDLLPAAAADEPRRDLDTGSLRVALRQMDDSLRRCVVLRHLHGRSHADIAKALNLTTGCVSMRIHRGLKQLASLYSAKVE